MPINLLTRCDGPGCEKYRLTPASQPPTDWLSINGLTFVCSWTCLALYAAQVAGQLEKPPDAPPNGAEPDADLEAATVGTAGTAE